jgi:hypothetical protein
MSTTIEATIVRGLGSATQTLQLQKPLLMTQFPEIADCHPATINLQLDRPLRVNNPDHTTEPIAWFPSQPEHFEKFSFLRIGFECPLGEPTRDAWIYIPHNSPHYADLFTVEIITARMDAAHVKAGTRCRVHIDGDVKSSEVLIV